MSVRNAPLLQPLLTTEAASSANDLSGLAGLAAADLSVAKLAPEAIKKAVPEDPVAVAAPLKKERIVDLKRSDAPTPLLAIAVYCGLTLLKCISIIVITALTLGIGTIELYKYKEKMDLKQKDLRNSLAVSSLKALGTMYSDNKDAFRNACTAHPEMQEHLGKIGVVASWGLNDDYKLFPSLKPYEQIQSFYRSFNAIVTSTEYEKLASDAPLRSLMEKIAVAMVEKVDSMDTYERFGEEILGSFEAPDSIGDIAQLLSDTLEHSDLLRRDSDSKFQSKLWAVMYPELAFQSVSSEFSGVYFESVASGNMLGQIWSYGDHVNALVGPGTFDPIMQVYLHANAKGESAVLQHHSLQGKANQKVLGVTVGKGEPGRNERWKALGEQSPNGRLRGSATSMDGIVWKMKDTGLKNLVGNPAAFFQKYQEQLEDVESHHVSETSLPLEKQQAAFDCSAEAFDGAKLDEDPTRLGHAMQLCAQGFISLGEVYQLQEEMQAASDLDKKKGANKRDICKQCIDRGAVLTVETRFLYLLAESPTLQNLLKKDGAKPDPDLLKKEIRRIVGVLVGRAYLVEKRLPMKERFEPLLDLLKVCSTNPAALINALNNFRAQFDTLPARQDPFVAPVAVVGLLPIAAPLVDAPGSAIGPILQSPVDLAAAAAIVADDGKELNEDAPVSQAAGAIVAADDVQAQANAQAKKAAGIADEVLPRPPLSPRSVSSISDSLTSSLYDSDGSSENELNPHNKSFSQGVARPVGISIS